MNGGVAAPAGDRAEVARSTGRITVLIAAVQISAWGRCVDCVVRSACYDHARSVVQRAIGRDVAVRSDAAPAAGRATLPGRTWGLTVRGATTAVCSRHDRGWCYRRC